MLADMEFSHSSFAEKITSPYKQVSRYHVRRILNGERRPGRAIANAIERVSRVWEHGPLLSEEWDRAEAAEWQARQTAAEATESNVEAA